jgi:tetratricopeptide (TPR) repeat protein
MPENEEKFLGSLKSARTHFEKKEYKNAFLMYFQALNHTNASDNIAIVWAEVSWVYYYQREYQKAVESAENVLMHNPEYKALDDLYRVQGYAYLGLDNLPLSERYLQLSLENNSSDAKQQYVKFELGKLYFRRGSYDLAHPYFEEILDFFRREKSDYAKSIYFYLGFINYYLGNENKSREYFEAIISEEPSQRQLTSAKFGIAFLEYQKKNYLNVIALCEQILIADNNFFDKESLGFLTAASYYHLGRKDIFGEYYVKMKDSYPRGRYYHELEKMNIATTE